MEEVVEDGLTNLCRLCGEVDTECLDLFGEGSQETELLSRIEESVQLAITQDDGLPSGVCRGCHEKLLGYSSFYRQCHDTQERLREFLSIEFAIHKTFSPEEYTQIELEDDEECGDDVYYYEEEAQDEGLEGEEEFMEIEECQGDQEQVEGEQNQEIEDGDNNNGSSLAATERKKELHVRSPSSEQKEDISKQCNPMQVQIEKNCSEGDVMNEPSLISPPKETKQKVIVVSLKKSNGSCLGREDTSSISVAPSITSEVPTAASNSVLQILKEFSKSVALPPLVPIARDITKASPVPSLQSSFPTAPTVKTYLSAKSQFSSGDNLSKGEFSDMFVKLSPHAEPILVPIARVSPPPGASGGLASKALNHPPSRTLVPISSASPELIQKVLDKYRVKKWEPPTKAKEVPVSNLEKIPTEAKQVPASNPKRIPTKVKQVPASNPEKIPTKAKQVPVSNSEKISEKTEIKKAKKPKECPSSVLIVKSNMTVKDPLISKAKGGGRVFIMTGDKSVAVEVDVVNTGDSVEVDCFNLGNNLEVNDFNSGNAVEVDAVDSSDASEDDADDTGNAKKSVKEDIGNKRDKEGLRHPKKGKRKTLLYLILKNGDAVELSDVERNVSLDQIPNPPVIVLRTSQQPLVKQSKINVKGEVKFLENSQYNDPAVELSSGLCVRAFPAMKSPCDLSTAPADEQHLPPSVQKTNFFVVQNQWSSQRKKKQYVVKRKRTRQDTTIYSEAAMQVEDIPVDPPQFKCKLCSSSYSDKKRCEYHVLSKHMTENCRYECDICGDKFATNILKTFHRKTKHFRSPDYICSFCGAKFRSLEVLHGHELRHSKKEAPFKCTICDKGFYTKGNLTKHKVDVHSVKKVICDVCGEAFSSNGRLNEHRWTHKGGLNCNECGKAFNSRSRLRAHKQIHRPVKFMHCACGKKFATFAFLHNHESKCPKASNNADLSESSMTSEEDGIGYQFE